LFRIIGGLIRLTRYKEFIAFVIITTLLGSIAADATFGWRLILVLVANWLAVGFAFMINDVEDAEDDALNPKKINRNPVSCKDLSERNGYIASFIIAGLALIAYAFLGTVPLILGVISLLLGFFYSWRPMRLKNIFLVDMISHCMMLAGLQYLPGYYTFQAYMTWRGLIPFIFMICFSLYGELFNELRDLDHDLKAGLRHTAAILGYKTTFRIMVSIAMVGIVAGVVSLFFIDLLSLWVLIVMSASVIVLMIPSLLKLREKKTQLELQRIFQEPMQNAAAVALSLNFFVPEIIKLFIKLF